MSTLPSDLLTSVEFIVIVLIAMFFSLVYETNRDLTWSGVIGGFTWIVLSMFNLVVYGSYAGTQTLAWLFQGIGWIYFIRILIDLISMRGASRKLAGEETY